MKTIALIALIFLSLTGNAQDMQKYLADTKEMVRNGKYKEALERDIWFHDHALEHSKGMAGVRLSFALGDWKSLADIYPPAMVALKDTRDKKTRLLINHQGSPDLFKDVAAINRTLGENAKTITLFELLAKNNPDVGHQYWPAVKEQLFAAKRYDIIRNYIGNPVKEFDETKKHYYLMTEMNKKFAAQNPRASADATDRLTQVVADNFVKHSVALIQYTIAVNDMNDAREIRKRAMVVVKDDRLNEAIQKR